MMIPAPLPDVAFEPDLVFLVVALAIAILILARIRYGEHLFSAETRWWGPLRRLVLPAAHSLLESVDPDGETGLYVTYELAEDEHVATFESEYHEILDDLAHVGYQPQPLAALKRDWEGRREVASWALYHGAKPFESAPDWLCERQTHVTLFADEDVVDGERIPLTIVTAHEEANPWRPDQWRDHYLARSMRIGVGVVQVAEVFGIEVDLDPSTADRSARGERARSFR